MIEKTTSKGWRVGDRVAWNEAYGAAILEVLDGDFCRIRFDDDRSGIWNMHDLGSSLRWRRLRSKRITLK